MSRFICIITAGVFAALASPAQAAPRAPDPWRSWPDATARLSQTVTLSASSRTLYVTSSAGTVALIDRSVCDADTDSGCVEIRPRAAVATSPQRDAAGPGLGHVSATYQEVPRVLRTGLGDMSLTRADVSRVVRTGRGDMTTHAPRAATQVPDRTPWLLIIAPVLLGVVVAAHYGARRRRPAGERGQAGRRPIRGFNRRPTDRRGGNQHLSGVPASAHGAEAVRAPQGSLNPDA
jgi:hypothetical protein